MYQAQGGANSLQKIEGVGGIPLNTQAISVREATPARKTYSCLEEYTFTENALLIDLQGSPCENASLFSNKSRYKYTVANSTGYNNFNMLVGDPVGTTDSNNLYQLYMFTNIWEVILYGECHSKLEVIRADGSAPFVIFDEQRSATQSSPVDRFQLVNNILNDDVRNVMVYKGDKLRYDFGYDISFTRYPQSGYVMNTYANGFGLCWRKKVIFN